MAYSIRPNNDFVLLNAQNENPNQLDIQLFTDFVQNPGGVSVGIPMDGGAFNFTTVSTNLTRSSADHTDYGPTSGHGFSSWTMTAVTGLVDMKSSLLIPGIRTPATNEVTKYEMEVGFKTKSAVWSAGDIYGLSRFGFMGTGSVTPTDGVYIEQFVNGTFDDLQGFWVDSTPLDTNWHVVFRKDSNTERYDTGVKVSKETIYQMYLSVERDSAGNFATNFKIRNVSSGVTTFGFFTPSSTSFYPSASTDYLFPAFVVNGIGDGELYGGLVPKYIVDYVGARVRYPIKREILI